MTGHTIGSYRILNRIGDNIVVFNFINLANLAEKRVYQLLRDKLHLFDPSTGEVYATAPLSRVKRLAPVSGFQGSSA